jgi:hypothetical protein
LLLAVTGFVTSLSIAEWRYARAWPPTPVEQGLSDLKAAQRAYPFLPRFREGMGRRLQVFGETGE